MAYKVLILAMLITLHSTALVFYSLFTFKWFVDSGRREIGIFGVCEYLNKTTVNGMLKEVARSQEAIVPSNFLVRKRNESQLEKEKLPISEIKFESSSNNLFRVRSNVFVSSSLPSIVKDSHENRERLEMSFRSMNALLLDDYQNDISYRKCFQLIWPTKNEAFKYLSTKSLYLTIMMGVAISSASLSILTLFWSFMCNLFDTVGSNLRANELLIVLSILTDISVISTLAMFIGKDEKIYPIRFYGFSFWTSVATSCGFFLTSILFTVNRINIRYNYMLRNYQKKLIEAY